MSAIGRISSIRTKLLWAGVIGLGTIALGVVALSRGESVNAAWLVIAAVCIYSIAYRFYALFIARKVLGVDPTRQTPAYRHNDGLDYVPTNRYVLVGHHFAAIAGAGAPRRSGARRPDGVPTRYPVDSWRRRIRRSGPGPDGPVLSTRRDGDAWRHGAL